MAALTLAKDNTDASKLGDGSSFNGCLSSGWSKLWLFLLILNLIFCAQVWWTTLSPHISDNTRQLAAAAVTVFSAWRIWRRHQALSPQTSTAGLTALLVSCALVFFSGTFHMMRLYSLANMALLATFVWTFFGLERLKKFFPPAFLLLFALPDLPEEFRAYIFIPLQHVCTSLAAETARLFVPITYSGHIFVVNQQSFNVAPSCSGLSMWACFLFAFAIWQNFKAYKPAAYVLAFLMDPILVITLNTVRLAITAIVAFYQSPKIALAIHSNLEIVLIPLGLLILWKAGARFAKAQ